MRNDRDPIRGQLNVELETRKSLCERLLEGRQRIGGIDASVAAMGEEPCTYADDRRIIMAEREHAWGALDHQPRFGSGRQYYAPPPAPLDEQDSAAMRDEDAGAEFDETLAAAGNIIETRSHTPFRRRGRCT